MNKIFYPILSLTVLFSAVCSEQKSAPETPESIMNRVDGSRYFEDLKLIAVDRTLGSPGHRMVQEFCARRLAELGYRVELDSYGTGTNVIGRIDGSINPDEIVILSAHYDSRNAGCPGADDNASGVAGVLEAARVLAGIRFEKTLVIALWDEEEMSLVKPRGLHGSRAYAARARNEQRDIIVALVFEMIGYRSFEPGSQRFPVWMNRYFPEEMKRVKTNNNRGDFICLTSDYSAKEYSGIFSFYAGSISLPSLTLNISPRIINIHDFRRSDHTAFWEKNYPAIVISDTINYRNDRYHCKNGKVDDISSLNTDFARDTIRAASATVARILRISN